MADQKHKYIKKIFLAAAGTGGHLYPAQKLASLLLEKNIESIFLGKGLKKNPFFQNSQFAFFEIAGSSIQTKNLFLLLKALFLLGKGFFQAVWKICRYKPELVIGFGSFHSFPTLLAAKAMGKKILLYEPNLACGKVNRFFSKKAHALVVHFPKVTAHNSKHMIQVPFLFEKEEMANSLARKKMGLKPDLFTFLVFGGSQGAVAINRLFLKTARELKDELAFQVIHITGKNDSLSKTQKTYQELGIPATVKEFEPHIHVAYLSSDLVICRAGAMTILELITYEKASILIPYPYATENHQEINADYLACRIQCAYKMTEKNLLKEKLSQKVKQMIKEKKIQAWQQNIAQFKKENQTSLGLNFVNLILNETK